MSLRSGAFSSPPRTPLGNLEVGGNSLYFSTLSTTSTSTLTSSPSYATAKTSQSNRKKSLRHKSSQRTFRFRHYDDADSGQGSSSAYGSCFEGVPLRGSNPVDDDHFCVGERLSEVCEGEWYNTPSRSVAGILPSEVEGEEAEVGDEDEAVFLTPSIEPRAIPTPPPPTTRSATPTAMLLHDGLFLTSPKALTHYPHVLEPITERTSVVSLRISLSTLRQAIPLETRLSPSARSPPSSPLNISTSSLSTTPTPEQRRRISPPPARSPTPLTHAMFKPAQSTNSSNSQLRDQYLLAADETPAEQYDGTQTARSSHEVATGEPYPRPKTPHPALAGLVPDGHYHPRNMLAHRRLEQEQQHQQQQHTTSEEEKKGGNETQTAPEPGMGTRMRRMKRRNHDAGQDTRMKGKKREGDDGGTKSTSTLRFGKRNVRAGKKEKRRYERWNRFWGDVGWVCCVVERGRWVK